MTKSRTSLSMKVSIGKCVIGIRTRSYRFVGAEETTKLSWPTMGTYALFLTTFTVSHFVSFGPYCGSAPVILIALGNLVR